MELHILLIEDNADDLRQIEQLIPDVFSKHGLDVSIDSKNTFEDGFKASENQHKRYDLIISDAYRGNTSNRDVAVTQTIEKYKEGKFCPIVVCSSGTKPDSIKESPFVSWADKGVDSDIENVLGEVLTLGIPQMAKSLHDDLDMAAGNYLWDFLEENWEHLATNEGEGQLERIIRRRAALVISDLVPGSSDNEVMSNRYGLEYYIYPSLAHDYYSLGDIIKKKDNGDIRVILTPHCHLFKQSGVPKPRADYILTIKAFSASSVLGEKITNAKGISNEKQKKKLETWSRSPAQTERKPEGRHWYLPKFLEIPHLFVDFLQVESIKYEDLEADFDCLATLAPPYAESLQACFSSYYGSVGIPKIDTSSIADLLE